MSNFSGNVRKNANSFKPQGSAGGARRLAAVFVFEKHRIIDATKWLSY